MSFRKNWRTPSTTPMPSFSPRSRNWSSSAPPNGSTRKSSCRTFKPPANPPPTSPTWLASSITSAGLRIADLPIADCGLRIADCGFADCALPIADCRLPGKTTAPLPASLDNPRSTIENPNPQSAIRNPQSANPQSAIGKSAIQWACAPLVISATIWSVMSPPTGQIVCSRPVASKIAVRKPWL